MNAPQTNPLLPQRNIVETALEAGRRLAVAPITSPVQDGKPFVVLTDGNGNQRIEFLTERLTAPERKMGEINVMDEDSFLEYYERQKTQTSTIYGQLEPAQFVAILDDHGASAGWQDHRMILTLKHSREYESWKGKNKQRFGGNEEFALWIEDQLPDFLEPEGARMMEIALNMRVNNNAAFSNAVRLQDGNTQFSYTANVEAQATNSSGQMVIPEQFKLSIPVWAGLNAKKYNFDARFRFRLEGGKLVLWYELIRPHKVIEQAFSDMLKNIEDKTKAKVIFGMPK